MISNKIKYTAVVSQGVQIDISFVHSVSLLCMYTRDHVLLKYMILKLFTWSDAF